MDNYSLYETDFYGWTQQQAKALADKKIIDLDWTHLQEEIEALGRQEYRELVNRLSILIGHLLKWEYQPEKRSRSGFLTIREQRRSIQRHFKHNTSLKSCLDDAMIDGHEAGVDLALRETELPLRTFPETSLYFFEQLLDQGFLCDTNEDWNN